MIDVHVVTPSDFGNSVTEVNGSLEAHIQFTDKFYIFELGYGGVAFLYRELKYSDGKYVNTGIRSNNQWLGDSPDGHSHSQMN